MRIQGSSPAIGLPAGLALLSSCQGNDSEAERTKVPWDGDLPADMWGDESDCVHGTVVGGGVGDYGYRCATTAGVGDTGRGTR